MLNDSRGKLTQIELYNLDRDISETTNIAASHPEIVQRLNQNLETVINRGTSRPGPVQSNDTSIDIHHTQTERWGPVL